MPTFKEERREKKVGAIERMGVINWKLIRWIYRIGRLVVFDVYGAIVALVGANMLATWIMQRPENCHQSSLLAIGILMIISGGGIVASRRVLNQIIEDAVPWGNTRKIVMFEMYCDRFHGKFFAGTLLIGVLLSVVALFALLLAI